VSCQHPPIAFNPLSHRRRQTLFSDTQVIGHLQVHPEFRRAVKRVVGTLAEWWGSTTKAAHPIRWLETKGARSIQAIPGRAKRFSRVLSRSSCVEGNNSAEIAQVKKELGEKADPKEGSFR
jgi:hypothetical protein